MESNESFISHTIKLCDSLLDGEREAEIGEVWDACADPADEWTAEQRAQYSEMLDQDDQEYWDTYLSKYCQVHDAELVNGKCSACVHEEQEENRADH